MKTLTLTIAEPWFSMIRDGKKKEEYREIKDHYLHQFYNYYEMQKFFGVPPQPYRMLGNGWTVEVIKHFFSFLPWEGSPAGLEVHKNIHRYDGYERKCLKKAEEYK